MKRLLLVPALLVLNASLAMAQQKDEATIRASLEKQSMDVFCRKTLREIAKTPPAKRNEPFFNAGQSIAFYSYGVNSTEFEDIQKKRIRIGTSECALVAALGRPEKTNKTVTARGYTMQWVYRELGSYVYTSNGKVTSWQE